MAIGDAIAAFLGTATTNRQPSSGVEEQLTAYAKSGATDKFNHYNGSVEIVIAQVGATGDGYANNGLVILTNNDTRIMSTNSVYLRKHGTTDRAYLGGVQTGA